MAIGDSRGGHIYVKQNRLQVTNSHNKQKRTLYIKGSIPQEDITITNLNAFNIRVPKYLKQTLEELKGEVNSNTVVVHFSIPLSLTEYRDRSSIRKQSS